eukprot:GHVU01015175.1.p3 GENE.GHVU01015175.1~~GHVU01015175.1.p3  ORF type:complete len:104 (-),score=14.02 GHVU01015175.1:149-460(-)
MCEIAYANLVQRLLFMFQQQIPGTTIDMDSLPNEIRFVNETADEGSYFQVDVGAIRGGRAGQEIECTISESILPNIIKLASALHIYQEAKQAHAEVSNIEEID